MAAMRNEDHHTYWNVDDIDNASLKLQLLVVSFDGFCVGLASAYVCSL